MSMHKETDEAPSLRRACPVFAGAAVGSSE